ncbi:C40 family peptidase [Paenibacillus sp. CF384]|uniref:C40 family peptidase n=1 Tax=Paenibacillus sp. CF384 TaxID=1884382 RepID=UPI00089CA4DB|nr:C40 family peptidase [Paenibacillus sp. CF384]SDW13238.1 Cell wall-associated hydrolase, NlpC family [Paenibacillus sp. CF384]
MNNTTKKRIGRKLAGVALSLSIAFAGSMLLTPKTTHAASDSVVASNIINKGKQYMGVPYKFGAKSGITSAFDCSSFVQYIYKKNGISLPRSSRQQAVKGTRVLKSNLKPGDLIFSDTNRDGKINHVSIYIGNGKVLQTYRVGIGVTISTFKGSIWDKTFVTARDVI